jgi:hypothetical protein
MMRRQEEHQEAKTTRPQGASKEQESTNINHITSHQGLQADSSVLHSPQQSPDPTVPKPQSKHVKLENLPFNSCGMLDRTRVALCSFLFAFLLVSPLNYLLPQLGSGESL